MEKSKADMSPQPPTFEYRNCGLCAAPNTPVKCPCQATHYCDRECQRKDKEAHKEGCTYWVRQNIDTLRKELQVLQAESNCSAPRLERKVEVVQKEDDLAGLHQTVGKLLRSTLLVGNCELAEEHYKQALQIYCRLAALAKWHWFFNKQLLVEALHAYQSWCSLQSVAQQGE